MENNSDKQLRDKLSSTEFPFDPQAWEQMEAMLDKKKKRRGFFWWWTGGIAAVLVLAVGTIGWGLYLMDEDDKQPYETSEQLIVNGQQTTINAIAAENSGSAEEKSENTTVAGGSGSKQPTTSGQLAVGKSEKSESEIAAVGSSSRQETSKVKNQKRKVNTRSNSSMALIRANHSGQQRQHTNALSKANKQLAIGGKQQYSNRKQQTTNNKTVADNLQPATGIQKEMEMLNAASAQASAEENISLTRREASLLTYVSENATTSFDKKEEDVLPKQKKKIFNYSIGVLANVTGASVGKQVGIPEQSTAPYFFCSKPSYMVGFTHDFLFVNRVAITNSILFSQTSFDVYYPKSTNFFISPSIYTSHITELAIPIGIKVYPVVKNNFRFYINTGIINHIKLKETFDYTMLDDTAYSNFIATSPNTLADQGTFPVETKFTGSYSPSAFGVQGSSNSTKDFSINNAKRYYTSFYAGAGFEYVAKKHFVLFTEPMFYMSLQKIGVQDKRKYNLGLTGGFRYQF